MSEKITLQSVAESFSKACGIPKKTAEQLARAFFETITDSLNTNESVKINGLGTFRVVNVASRESINVTNGERIVIDGYKKVTFTPEEGLALDKVVESVEENGEVVTEDSGADVAVDDDVVLDDNSVEKAVNEVETPRHVEKKEDEFSGIDMLICTPESVAEIRLELEAARDDAARKLQAAKDARREVLRLEALLEKMEKGVQPENVDDECDDTDVTADSALAFGEEVPQVDSAADSTVVAESETVAEPEAVVESDVAADVVAEVQGEVEVEEKEPALAAASVSSTNDNVISVEVPEECKEAEEETVVAEDDTEAEAEQKDDATGVVEEEIPAAAEEPEVEDEQEKVADEEKNEETATVAETSEETETSEVPAEENAVAETEESESSDDKEETDAESDAAEAETETASSEAVVEKNGEVSDEDKPDEEKKEEALNRFLSDTNQPAPVKEEKSYLIWILLPMAIILIAGCSIIAFKYHSDKAKQELKELPVKPKSSETPARTAPQTNNVAPVNQNVAASENAGENVAKPEAPKADKAADNKTADKAAKAKVRTHELQNGESLTRVSQKYYNTKDSVAAIIRVNNFKDPNNVPAGTVIKLP